MEVCDLDVLFWRLEVETTCMALLLRLPEQAALHWLARGRVVRGVAGILGQDLGWRGREGRSYETRIRGRFLVISLAPGDEEAYEIIRAVLPPATFRGPALV